jgi:GNAT superfamily N-acetyltransferase
VSDTHGARRAALPDREVIETVITLSFREDPLWSTVLARPDGSTAHHRELWRLFVEGALRYRWTWMTGGGEAIAVWIPPGGTELTPELEIEYEEFARTRLGTTAEDFLDLSDRFEAAHPRDQPHYPDHRGHGIGMRLLSDTLDVIDAEHLPAYLESSNPDNDPRYARLGFEPVGEILYRGVGPRVTTMWRAAR